MPLIRNSQHAKMEYFGVTLSPLDCKEIQPVPSKGDHPWVSFGRNDAKAETPVFWPPHAKSWPIGKDFDAGRDWGQEKKGTTEDEMAGWHHWLDGHESGSWWWTGRPGVLQFMGSQRVRHDWATELNWTVRCFPFPEMLKWENKKLLGIHEIHLFSFQFLFQI